MPCRWLFIWPSRRSNSFFTCSRGSSQVRAQHKKQDRTSPAKGRSRHPVDSTAQHNTTQPLHSTAVTPALSPVSTLSHPVVQQQALLERDGVQRDVVPPSAFCCCCGGLLRSRSLYLTLALALAGQRLLLLLLRLQLLLAPPCSPCP